MDKVPLHHCDAGCPTFRRCGGFAMAHKVTSTQIITQTSLRQANSSTPTNLLEDVEDLSALKCSLPMARKWPRPWPNKCRRKCTLNRSNNNFQIRSNFQIHSSSHTLLILVDILQWARHSPIAI